MKIVFMGTPDFAVPSLDAIAESDHELVGAVTQPDRGSGRGRKKSFPAVKKAARRRDIPVYQPEDINTAEAAENLRDWNADAFVVAAYGQILSAEILEVPRHGCLNIHASLLPKLRGAAPINWAIIRGEQETGVTIMQMDEGLDTGPILSSSRVSIGPKETAGQLHNRLAELGASVIVETLDKLAEGKLEPVPQDDSEATYAPMLSKSDGALNWAEPSIDVANHIRGVNPWPGAYTAISEGGADLEHIKLHRATAIIHDYQHINPGTVLQADPQSDTLRVACGEGAVDLEVLQPANRQKMAAADFLNGYDIETGVVFESAP